MSKKDNTIVFEPVDLGEGRILTIAAKPFTLPVEDEKKPLQVVRFGHSIKNPEDLTSNPELGAIIAKGRAEKASFAHFAVFGDRIPRQMIEKVGAVLAEDFKHRLGNYVVLKSKSKIQSA
jgi:hypothetical protein